MGGCYETLGFSSASQSKTMKGVPGITLNPRLANDCIVLGRLNISRLLLLNNSLVPWFILVPDTSVTEIYELATEQQLKLLEEINIISSHLKQNFTVDKLNVAAIGNIVKQMHIHIVARQFDDFCWPGVVWGANGKKLYTTSEVEKIRSQLIENLSSFTPLAEQ